MAPRKPGDALQSMWFLWVRWIQNEALASGMSGHVLLSSLDITSVIASA